MFNWPPCRNSRKNINIVYTIKTVQGKQKKKVRAIKALSSPIELNGSWNFFAASLMYLHFLYLFLLTLSHSPFINISYSELRLKYIFFGPVNRKSVSGNRKYLSGNCKYVSGNWKYVSGNCKYVS